jgi:hypothetical protein
MVDTFYAYLDIFEEEKAIVAKGYQYVNISKKIKVVVVRERFVLN